MPELLLEEVGLKRLDGKIPELLLELNLHKGKSRKNVGTLIMIALKH